jgi:Arc/MetJ family transcription regulator
MHYRERVGVRIVENILDQKLRGAEFALELAKINRLWRFASCSRV